MKGFVDGYAETPEGLLFMADGISAPVRWNGISAGTQPVGVAAPTSAATMAKSSSADPAPARPATACTTGGDPTAVPAGVPSSTRPLTGTYLAYVRWADAAGVYSPLSPVSNTLNLSDPSVLSAAAQAAQTAAATADGAVHDVYAAAAAAMAAGISAMQNLQSVAGVDLSAQIAVTLGMQNACTAGATAAGLCRTDFTAAAAATATPDQASTATAAAAAVTAFDTAAAAVVAADLVWIAGSGFSFTFTAGSPSDLANQAAAQAMVAASVATVPIPGSYATAHAANVAAVAAAVLAQAAVAAGVYGLVYTNVPVPPGGSGVVSRQILRNVAGDLVDFYVDIDTSDITSTTLRSTNTDAALAAAGGIVWSVGGPNVTPGISGTYYAFVRFLNEVGAVSNLSPISNTLILADADYAYGITYTNVPVPTQANVVRRQILRNTAGQASVFYVDVDTADLTATTFTGRNFDTALQNNEAVPLFDTAGNVLANAHGLPPDHKTAMAHHLGRMFLAVDRNYDRGGVTVSSGSATVRGIDTDWTSAMVGRFLWVDGATAPCQIDAVDVPNQALALDAPYGSPSDPYASYTIRPALAERRLVYYSMAGQPESWPATSAVSIQEDGDELTGLMVMGSFLHVLERRHIYRYTFQSDPATDGFVFLSASRGCVNNRCWVQAEGTAYMLDYSGIHSFDGGDSTPLSDPVQHLFRSETSGPRLNWGGSELFFAVHSADEQYIRWFVTLAGESRPRHAIGLDYRSKRFWLEEYDRPITSGCEGTFEFRRRVFLGGEANGTYLGHQSALEGVDPTAGPLRGVVTAATAFTLTDASAQWPAGLAGNSVTIVAGRGVGQTRTISQQSGTALRLAQPWLILPDSSSSYQIAGIPWVWHSGWLRLAIAEDDTPRKVEVLYDTLPTPANLTLRIFRDYATLPTVWYTTRNAKQGEGFASRQGSPDLVAGMNTPRGQVQQRMDGHKELNMEGTRTISVELSGCSTVDEQTIYEVTIDGVKP